MKLKSVFHNRMKELLNAHMEDPAFDRAAFISAEGITLSFGQDHCVGFVGNNVLSVLRISNLSAAAKR